MSISDDRLKAFEAKNTPTTRQSPLKSQPSATSCLVFGRLRFLILKTPKLMHVM